MKTLFASFALALTLSLGPGPGRAAECEDAPQSCSEAVQEARDEWKPPRSAQDIIDNVGALGEAIQDCVASALQSLKCGAEEVIEEMKK